MSRIKECFTSRFGKDGMIMEADFSQLEVVGLAIVSDDEELKKDILNGIDFHAQTACWLYGYEYEDFMKHYTDGDTTFKKMRQSAKEPNFLNQYGGGAWLMAKNTGIRQDKCQKFIDEYYKKYHGVKRWQEDVIAQVKASRMPSKKKSSNGVPLGMGVYTSPTGRKYVFYEYENDNTGNKWARREQTSFSPTEMKNYPVQGFATGDIVPEVLGSIYRFIRKHYGDKVVLVGTVHDSIVLDVHHSIAYIVGVNVQSIMHHAGAAMYNRYGIKIDIPISAEVSVAESWAGCK